MRYHRFSFWKKFSRQHNGVFCLCVTYCTSCFLRHGVAKFVETKKISAETRHLPFALYFLSYLFLKTMIKNCRSQLYCSLHCNFSFQNVQNGEPIVPCNADPCDAAFCPRFPHAICTNNYCGECNAVFTDRITGEVISSDSCQLPRESS